ncbi:bifunctional tRNA (5-methylaminomethyl-2-thiouridine)(34)-methyltransferase MnmD/FAD-dependent 5-carboxymethylaminomethyl-2-thiouridine(34) oxidoreductase MnmC [Mycoavidus sp. B2-EB]|uniref:bifunctional tRNA (5-methylaminomethyl-2-thiouridine)(34)-methyltransferase MnmD/FAD-dependent 5-carboxymethylaminomethyl-2-thiouridine(34) oxidoreductase MnmC n=1 Tax=Mycoavidus sp. B2-EB TaxID=2651972 RepID=UPI001627EF3C|nr:bifunctional tRNA (5-methylaminomethyl-2-thiouridine)(34)-methyltransferase MnmD/FAD-dependent 5-carboxymethylaminomethyl-2-thiouridine(34) oxidoreductase MnmC [Mycoavidus sp. B2-EB]BBO58943.1 tRNA 5-methylaminomethyl-2-thiouridine biosynthesis bifunctional protein MnmC [Mycoavidus sp. B2-EB]
MPTIIPAPLTLLEDGTPYSAAFSDIYHSAAGGFTQAQRVFMAGNQLPARWAGQAIFSIVETGFGAGINFLATWAAWRDDPARCARLHFVSIEKHPFTRENLHLLQQRLINAKLAPLTRHLCAAWPILTSGLHRLEFEEGRVILTLALGDIRDLLPQLWLRADAFYLDGFAPAKNPDMWHTSIFKALARLAAPNATLATYTTAGVVRHGLIAAGFEIHKAQGFGMKREMLIGHFAPRWRVRRHEPPTAYVARERHALVIGAGFAGCALTERLAARGWHVSLIEQSKTCAAGASGNPVSVFHPFITRDDNAAARASRAGFLYALRRWQTLAPIDTFLWRAQGLIQIAANQTALDAMQATLSRLAYPAELVSSVTRAEASALAGLELAQGGWYFPRGGWLDPASLCQAQLITAGAALTPYFQHKINRLVYRENLWHALDDTGRSIVAAPVAILANANDAARLAGLHYVQTHSIRGQLTALPTPTVRLQIPITGSGYLAPLTSTSLLAGASYELDDPNPMPCVESHQHNLNQLAQLAPSLANRFDPNTLAGYVAFRCVANDRMPFIGPIADEHAAQRINAQSLDVPRAPGLFGAFAYGSRGLVWATLGAELIASQLDGEPMPIERSLIQVLDPARFLLRALRQKN